MWIPDCSWGDSRRLFGLVLSASRGCMGMPARQECGVNQFVNVVFGHVLAERKSEGPVGSPESR